MLQQQVNVELSEAEQNRDVYPFTSQSDTGCAGCVSPSGNLEAQATSSSTLPC